MCPVWSLRHLPSLRRPWSEPVLDQDVLAVRSEASDGEQRHFFLLRGAEPKPEHRDASCQTASAPSSPPCPPFTQQPSRLARAALCSASRHRFAGSVGCGTRRTLPEHWLAGRWGRDGWQTHRVTIFFYCKNHFLNASPLLCSEGNSNPSHERKQL